MARLVPPGYAYDREQSFIKSSSLPAQQWVFTVQYISDSEMQYSIYPHDLIVIPRKVFRLSLIYLRTPALGSLAGLLIKSFCSYLEVCGLL